MKKSLLLLLTIAAFIFTGCGGSSEGLDPAAGDKQEQAADTAVPESGSEQAAASEAPVETATEESATAEGESVATADGASVEDATVLFDFDKFNIRTDMVPVVEALAEKLKNSTAAIIKVEGNCDEWGTDEYNYALGLKRAKSVKDALGSYGVDTAKLKLISYGESNPVCTDKNDACWAKNRRVEFSISE